MAVIKNFRELEVYRSAMDTCMTVFETTKTFPSEEKFSLVDQMRRSSRSVCASIAEAWRKRLYQAAFLAKLNDAETEAAEMQVWAEVAFRCAYIDEAAFNNLDQAYEHILAQLVKMSSQPEKWTIRTPQN